MTTSTSLSAPSSPSSATTAGISSAVTTRALPSRMRSLIRSMDLCMHKYSVFRIFKAIVITRGNKCYLIPGAHDPVCTCMTSSGRWSGSPLRKLAEDFDTGRIGLVVEGRPEIRAICCALDATPAVVKAAADLNADMLVCTSHTSLGAGHYTDRPDRVPDEGDPVSRYEPLCHAHKFRPGGRRGE